MKEEALNFAYSKLWGANEKLKNLIDKPISGITQEAMEICLRSAKREIEKMQYIIKTIEEHGTD